MKIRVETIETVSSSEISEDPPFDIKEIDCDGNYIDFDLKKALPDTFNATYKVRAVEKSQDGKTIDIFNFIITFEASTIKYQCIDSYHEGKERIVKYQDIFEEDQILKEMLSMSNIEKIEEFDKDFLLCAKSWREDKRYPEDSHASYYATKVNYQSKSKTFDEYDLQTLLSQDHIYKDISGKYFRYIVRDIERDSWICIQDYKILEEHSDSTGNFIDGQVDIYEENTLKQLLEHGRLRFMFPTIGSLGS